MAKNLPQPLALTPDKPRIRRAKSHADVVVQEASKKKSAVGLGLASMNQQLCTTMFGVVLGDVSMNQVRQCIEADAIYVSIYFFFEYSREGGRIVPANLA